MLRNRSRKCASISRAATLVAFGLAPSAWAANLLVNPGFESPAELPGTNTSNVATGWTFYGPQPDRATFEAHTGTWSDWEEDFEPVGGVYQIVDNIVPGTSYTLTAWQYFEANFNTTGETVDMELTWQDSSGTTVGTPNIYNVSAGSVPTLSWMQFTLATGTDSNGNPVVAPAGATQVGVSFDYSGPGSSGGQLSSYVDDVDLEGAGVAPTIATWALTGSGDWNVSGDWSTGNIPNAPGQEADFFSAITANSNVYSDIAVTAGILNFNSPFTYVIDGAGSLSLQTSSGSAQVIVQQGTAEINLPTTLVSNTVFNVASGSTLVIGNPLTIDTGVSLTQLGTGTVDYESIITVLTGGALALADSTHAAALNLQGTASASLQAHASGASPVALELDSLSIGGSTNNWTAKFDVANNELILNNGNLATTTNQVKEGLGGVAGIVSSTAMADTTHLTTLGVIQNETPTGGVLYTSFGGETGLTAADVLVKYTYYGDANLDGQVNASDYSLIDNGYLNHLTGWANGDFNYDGVVNGSDYTLIDNTFNRQGAAIPDSAIAEEVATPTAELPDAVVPEPAALSLLALALPGMLSRRQRKN